MTQISIDFAASPGAAAEACVVEAAFTAGWLSLIVDDVMPIGRALGARGWYFAGDATINMDARVRVVHVMSASARGEIRGYVLTLSDGVLRQRGPCYAGPWAVLDAAVLARVAGASRVVPL